MNGQAGCEGHSSTPALRGSLTGPFYAAHAQVIDGQGAARISCLCAEWNRTEGVALRGAGDAHPVTLPFNLQNADGDIGRQRIVAVGTGGAFKPVGGLQQGCAGLGALTSQNQTLVAGPGEAGEYGHTGQRQQQFDEGEASWEMGVSHGLSVMQHMPAVPPACL